MIELFYLTHWLDPTAAIIAQSAGVVEFTDYISTEG